MLKSLSSASHTIAAIVLALWAFQFVTGTSFAAGKPRRSLNRRAIVAGKRFRKRDSDLLAALAHTPDLAIVPSIRTQPR